MVTSISSMNVPAQIAARGSHLRMRPAPFTCLDNAASLRRAPLGKPLLWPKA
jgi:hypothetical protein